MQLNKVFAYCRVSSKDQSLDRQLHAVKEYATMNNLTLDDRDIITDIASGKDFNRDGYRLLTDRLLRANDTLIIKELDRLGRDYKSIKEEWQKLNQLCVNLIIIDMPLLNTANKSDLEKHLISNIVLELLAYTAELERTKIKQRQKEGIASAKGKGVKFGRPKFVIPDSYVPIYTRWAAGEMTAVKAMGMLGIKKTKFYQIANLLNITKQEVSYGK